MFRDPSAATIGWGDSKSTTEVALAIALTATMLLLLAEEAVQVRVAVLVIVYMYYLATTGEGGIRLNQSCLRRSPRFA